MNGISSELYSQIRRVILDCGPVQTQAELRAVFADPRLLPWRDGLPESSKATNRAEGLIAYLQGRNNLQGQNALVLFLQVAADRLSSQDVCHQALNNCADKLTIAGPLEPEENDTAVQVFEVLINKFNLDELKTLCFFLDIKYEELPGDTISGKVRELILYIRNRDRMDDLIKTIQRVRTDIHFP